MKGQHLIIDIYDCQTELLNNAIKLNELLTKMVNDIGMEILSTRFHTFKPQGVTGVLILSTSHFSIHTWPENGYAALDLYTCGNTDLWEAIEDIVYQFQAKSARIYEIVRGENVEMSSVIKKVILPPE